MSEEIPTAPPAGAVGDSEGTDVPADRGPGSGRFDPWGAQEPQSALPWYKRRWVLITAASVIVAVVAVLSDLPHGASRPVQIAGDNSVMQQINSNLASCTFAAKESFQLYGDLESHSLDAARKALVPGLLSQDADACSFTSEYIFNLTSIEVPGSPAGKYLQDVVGVVTTWATSDALLAIESIEKLWVSPHDATAARQLSEAERELRDDRIRALTAMQDADNLLHTKLVKLGLPALPVS